MSRPRVNKSSEQNFIKVILTKDQRRDKRNKKWMRIRKSRCIESNETHCGPQSVRSPGGHTLFFWGFLRSSCQNISSFWSTAALGSDHGLLLGTRVQLVVSCTIIEAQVVFQDAFYACHWSTCHCWLAWKRGPPMKSWVVSWKQGTKMISRRRRSWQMRLSEMSLLYFGKPWQDQRWKLFLAS